MTKSEAGKLGQAALQRKLGSDYYSHMRRIAANGGVAFWLKYRYEPVGIRQFAIVRRIDGRTVGYNPR